MSVSGVTGTNLPSPYLPTSGTNLPSGGSTAKPSDPNGPADPNSASAIQSASGTTSASNLNQPAGSSTGSTSSNLGQNVDITA